MTLVYDRQPTAPGPRTHAFVLGCGRFPAFGPTAARQSTVAGARAILKFLHANRDLLEAPLATIECLLSDATVSRGADKLAVPEISSDPDGGVDDVDAVLFETVRLAGEAWLGRCDPGDHLFFYMSSHGVADRDFTGAALFEDVRASKFNKWGQSLNINALAVALPTTGAGACWVFLDACQEIVPSLLGQYNGASGLTIIAATAQEIANTPIRTMSLAGSRFGQQGWAPATAAPPYFTQALLRGFEACVERPTNGGWVVTGQQLQYHVRHVADAAFGYTLETQPLCIFADEARLLRVPNPRIPVVVRTVNRAHMSSVLNITCSSGGPPLVEQPRNQACFFELPPDGLTYSAAATFNVALAYQPATFEAKPCYQNVELVP